MLITNILIFNKLILCFNNFKLRFNGNKEEAATRNKVMNLKFLNIFFKWPRSLIFFFMHHLFNFYKINKISFTIYYKIFNLFINEFIRLKVWDRSIQYYSRGLVRISQGGIIHAFLHSAIHLFTYSFINPYYCKLDWRRKPNHATSDFVISKKTLRISKPFPEVWYNTDKILIFFLL